MAQSITKETISVVIPTTYHTKIYVKQLSRDISVLLGTLVELYGSPTLWTDNNNGGVQTFYLNPAIFQLADNNL